MTLDKPCWSEIQPKPKRFTSSKSTKGISVRRLNQIRRLPPNDDVLAPYTTTWQQVAVETFSIRFKHLSHH